MDLLLGGSLGGLIMLFLFVLAVLWFLLPFAIFGTKNILKDLTTESEKTNELLAEILAEIKMKSEVDNTCCENNDDDKQRSKSENLVASLKKNKTDTDFSNEQSLCEICNDAETGQLINKHYVCAKCRSKYLS